MSHEPGRERFMQYFCECCGERMEPPGIYVEHAIEYWCESCVDQYHAIKQQEEEEADE